MPRVPKASKFHKGDLVRINGLCATTRKSMGRYYSDLLIRNNVIGQILEITSVDTYIPQYAVKFDTGVYGTMQFWLCGKDLEKLFTI